MSQRPRMGWYENLRVESCYLDVSGVRDLDRQRMVRDVKCIGIECIPLEFLGHLINNAVVLNRRFIWHDRFENDHVVELYGLSLLDSNPKLQRRAFA